MGESVHLRDWPKVGHVNELILSDMAKLRHIITDGLAQRAEAGVKVRQPLSEAKVYGAPDLGEIMREIIAEELNVKKVELVPRSPKLKGDETFEEVVKNAEGTYSLLDIKISLDLQLTPDLKREGMMREVVRQVQNARKQAGMQVDDRIKLVLSSDHEELSKTIHEFADEIKQEVLALHLSASGKAEHVTVVRVEGAALTICIGKA